MDDAEARTIGRRLRQIRRSRKKSMQVVAELAGMNRMTLQRIETGVRAVTLPEIVALAGALQIAPSELTQLPVPAPANGHTDSTIEAVRLALDSIEVDRSGGLVLPVAVLRDQVTQLHARLRSGRFAEVAADLPGLIRNLHTALDTGTDHGELLDLAVYLHVHVTRNWLHHAGAPTDLRRRAVFLVRRLAQERDEVSLLAMAGLSVADALLGDGAFELGQAALDSITPPPATAGTAGLVGLITATRAHAALLTGRPGEAAAYMDAATEQAGRFGVTGETDSQGFLYSPTSAAISGMCLALEADEPDQAESIARGIDPRPHPFAMNQAYYWVHYGRALARLRGRRDDAVQALSRAETSYPLSVQRNPFVHDVVAELLTRTRRDSPAGRELRAMAYRAGLPV